MQLQEPWIKRLVLIVQCKAYVKLDIWTDGFVEII